MLNEKLIPMSYNGVIGVYQGEKTLLEKSFGYRDLPNQLKANLDTLFGTASAGKAFVAIGIMQLIEAGKLTLTTRLAALLPANIGNIDPEITIYELLTHTSTIQDYFDETVMTEYAELWQETPNYRIRRNRDLYPLFMDKPVNLANRGKFQYNNSGFVMLAAVIEELTGSYFDDYLQQAVFEPAGMIRTGYYSLDCLPANTANAYSFNEEIQQYETNIYKIDVKGTGAGGCFTTLKEIRLFWQALFSDKLLSPASRELIFSQQATNGTEFYGLGFWLKPAANQQFIPYFEGMDPGICFYSLFDSQLKVNLTAISNKQDNVWQLAESLLEQVETEK